MTKSEVDALFQALSREYESLDSDFRRRICLRNQVMMKLLFYHGIEISQLLRMKVSDYDRSAAVILLPVKTREKRKISLFSSELREQLSEWLTVREYFDQNHEKHVQMFLSKFGKPLSMKMVIKVFDKYRTLAGIEREYTPKSLKNSFSQYAQELAMRECG